MNVIAKKTIEIKGESNAYFYKSLVSAQCRVSFLGLAKRAAAGAAGAAVIAGTGVGVASVVQDPQKKAVSRAISTHAPNITPEIRELVMKANSENVYSKMFLYEKQNHDLLEAIIAVCLDGNALPAEQCDIASTVKARLVRKEVERAEWAKAQEYNRKFREGLSTDGIIPR